jgi:hypothetical protein
MLLLNDGFFWDDNLLYSLIQGRHYEELSVWTWEMGLPSHAIFFRGLDLLVGITNHRLVSFFTIFLSAVLLNDLFKRYAGDAKFLSMVFTVFYVTLFPFKSTVLLCTTQYQVTLFLFLLAIHVRLRFKTHESSLIRRVATFIFLGLSFISFSTASILVLYYYYFLFEYFYVDDDIRDPWDLRNFGNFVRSNTFTLLLPIIFWAIKNTFFRSSGVYVDYNKIRFDLSPIISSFFSTFDGLVAHNAVFNVIALAPRLFIVLVALFFIFTAFPKLVLWRGCKLPPCSSIKTVWLMWSVGFLLVSAFPYAVANLHPGPQGWESRHYLLFTLSWPCFILATGCFYFQRVKTHANAQSIDCAFRKTVVCIALAGALNSNLVYLDYQAIAIKQWSVVENLRVRPDLKKYSSFWIDDQVGDFSKKGFAWHEATHQAWYEWVAIFTKAWGEEKWFGNNVGNRQAEFSKSVRYGASEINPSGLECLITIRNLVNYSKFGHVRRYLYIKYLGSNEELKRHLLSLVSIESCQAKE